MTDTGILLGRGERKEFLKGLGIRVSEGVVRAVIECCSGGSGLRLYELYTKNKTPQQAGKPTIYKIKRLYESGAFAGYVEYLDSERLASSSEVDAPTQVDGNRTILAAKSDGFRPGVLAQFPPLSFAPAIQRFIDNEQAKYSKNLDNINQALQAQIASHLERIAQPTFLRSRLQ